jgi:hypothetical protein
MVQKSQEELEFIGMHQHLDSADDVSLLGENTNTIKKNAETLFYASKDIGIEVNTKKTKYMFIFCHQNARQNHKYSQKYLGKTSNKSTFT